MEEVIESKLMSKDMLESIDNSLLSISNQALNNEIIQFHIAHIKRLIMTTKGETK